MTQDTFAKLNRLAKWRSVFAGWFLGTRSDTDEQCKAYKDLQERNIIMRAELNAFGRLLISKGIVTDAELDTLFGVDADELSKLYEKKFPGFKAIDAGISMTTEAIQTTKNWPK